MQTVLEDKQSLSSLLEMASLEGEVRIQRSNGQAFVLKQDQAKSSVLDVAGIDLGITTKEIIDLVREGRERP